jgi:hypothetical protein
MPRAAILIPIYALNALAALVYLAELAGGLFLGAQHLPYLAVICLLCSVVCTATATMTVNKRPIISVATGLLPLTPLLLFFAFGPSIISYCENHPAPYPTWCRP